MCVCVWWGGGGGGMGPGVSGGRGRGCYGGGEELVSKPEASWRNREAYRLHCRTNVKRQRD